MTLTLHIHGATTPSFHTLERIPCVVCKKQKQTFLDAHTNLNERIYICSFNCFNKYRFISLSSIPEEPMR